MTQEVSSRDRNRVQESRGNRIRNFHRKLLISIYRDCALDKIHSLSVLNIFVCVVGEGVDRLHEHFMHE